MKKLFLLVALAATACSGPIGNVNRIWPDGASVWIGEFTVQASMSGAGSVVMRDVRWTGTNGFALPVMPTNQVVTPTK